MGGGDWDKGGQFFLNCSPHCQSLWDLRSSGKLSPRLNSQDVTPRACPHVGRERALLQDGNPRESVKVGNQTWLNISELPTTLHVQSSTSVGHRDWACLGSGCRQRKEGQRPGKGQPGLASVQVAPWGILGGSQVELAQLSSTETERQKDSGWL